MKSTITIKDMKTFLGAKHLIEKFYRNYHKKLDRLKQLLKKL